MLNLTDRKWKEFKIKEITEKINISKSINYGETIPGNNIFIGRRSDNNGIQGFVTNNIVEKKNCITIGMVGTMKAFWQNNDFLASQNILILRNHNFNKYNSHFLITLINQLLKKYSYGNPVKKETFCHQKIMLPINSNNEPDYEFMSCYIKERMDSKYKVYIDYCEKKIKKIKETININFLNNKLNYEPFKINNLFKLEKVYGKPLENYNAGNIPYISTSGINNGLISYVKNDDGVSKGNCISVDPIKGTTFYQPYDFIGRGFSGASINLLRNNDFNEFKYVFIATCVSNTAKLKASYANLFNGDRLKNAKILLPVNNDNIDYKYIENYIKIKELEKYEEYLSYLKEEAYV